MSLSDESTEDLTHPYIDGNESCVDDEGAVGLVQDQEQESVT